MNTDTELDRSEAATPYKLQEARKRGQVPRSAELASAAALAGAVIVLHVKGWEFLVALFQFDRRLLGQAATAGTNPPHVGVGLLVEHVVAGGLAFVLPPLAAVMVVAVLANLVQTGAVLSFHPIRPDWNKLHPSQGFQRIASIRTAVDAARAVVKLGLLGCVAFVFLGALAPRFGELSDMTPQAFGRVVLDEVASLGFALCSVLLVTAAVDVAYSRREFARRMRMSRRELRDEFKHREGDPRIRARLRDIRRELLKRTRALRRTVDADVVLTNPTHVAVALRYRHGEMDAPVMVSKGAGALAAAIRVIAARRRIPVVRHPSLARALHRQGSIDLPIPVEFYAGVARVLVWVLALKDARRPSTSAREEVRS